MALRGVCYLTGIKDDPVYPENLELEISNILIYLKCCTVIIIVDYRYSDSVTTAACIMQMAEAKSLSVQ